MCVCDREGMTAFYLYIGMCDMFSHEQEAKVSMPFNKNVLFLKKTKKLLL